MKCKYCGCVSHCGMSCTNCWNCPDCHCHDCEIEEPPSAGLAEDTRD